MTSTTATELIPPPITEVIDDNTSKPSIISAAKEVTIPAVETNRPIPRENHQHEEPFHKYASPLISERAVDQPRPLKVIYIGAGISGIISAIQFRNAVPDIDLVIYEKNPELGGTWFENRYPGCACGEYLYQKSNGLLMLWPKQFRSEC